MIRSIILGTILGGLTAFLWSNLSWAVFPWHEKSLQTFQNEDEVSAVISSHSSQSGNYILPAGPSQEGLNSEQKKAAQEILAQKMQKGPIMFAAIRRQGFGSYARGLIAQGLIQLVAALLITWLLLQTAGLRYARRVAFCAIIGLTGGIIVDLPNWNWWGASGAYTAVNVVDYTLTWLLAGLVIAKFAKRSAPVV